jgi:hypothetical protein
MDRETIEKSWLNEMCETEDGFKEILDNIGMWMKLGTNIIGGCCQIGPKITKLISEKITMEMYGVLQARQEEDEKNTNPDEEWSSVLQRLEKPHEDLRKTDRNKGDLQERFHVRDVTGIDGGEGAFSRLHHDMENVIRNNERKKSKNDNIICDP